MSTQLNTQSGLAGCLALLIITALAANGAGTMSLFNGKDLSGWKPVGGRGAVQWKVGKAVWDSSDPGKLSVGSPGDELISPEKGVNLATEASFQDCRLELEFLVAKDSNSGVKMMNIYEIQILDGFDEAGVGKGDCGAIYKESAPRVNACKKAGEWQQLVIEFRAPRFDAAGKKTANARFLKVILNGQVVQEDVEIAHGTNVSRNAPEKAAGPVYLQGDHGPVAFRHLKITPLN